MIKIIKQKFKISTNILIHTEETVLKIKQKMK